METAGLSLPNVGASASGVLLVLAEPLAKLALDTLPLCWDQCQGPLPPPLLRCLPLASSSLAAEQAEPHMLSGKISAA